MKNSTQKSMQVPIERLTIEKDPKIVPTRISYLPIWSLLMLTSLIFAGCGSTSKKSDDTTLASMTQKIETTDPADVSKKSTESSMQKESKMANAEDKEDVISLNESSSAATEALLLTPVIALSSASRLSGAPKRAKKQPAGVIDFCKVLPYAKNKRQVKNGIKAAWDAKLAKKYGVGFRNKAEYKKWSNTQKEFFLYIFDACRSFALCELDNMKNSKKNKTIKSCGLQKATFEAWQDSAQRFAKEVKKFKTQQPAALCGLQPNNGDVSLCFKLRSSQIDDACDGAVCKELSQCWTSVAMKDDVIRQSESSCGFSGQKLSECRSHIEATIHRKDRFTACNTMQNDIDLAFQP